MPFKESRSFLPLGEVSLKLHDVGLNLARCHVNFHFGITIIIEFNPSQILENSVFIYL